MPRSLEGQTVLVTGVTGFVGGDLARRLTEEGAVVRAGVRRPDAVDVEVDTIVELDLTEPSGFPAAVEHVDVVVNAAAWVGFGDESLAEAVNVDGPTALYRAASSAGVARFVQLSTCAVLGLDPALPIDGTTPADPDQDDAYHRSKALMEQAMKAAAARATTELVVLRPGIVYGPGSRGWTSGMLKLVERGTPVVFGDGDGLAFPVYIDNLVDACVLAMTVDGAAGHTFHIVDTTVPWSRWFRFFGDMCGREPRSLPLFAGKALAAANELLPLGLPLDRERLAMMQTRFRFDASGEREILGWEPRVSLEEGMSRSEAWLRETGRL